MTNDENIHNIFHELAKGEKILNLGSRVLVLILTSDAFIVNIFSELSVQLTAFILISTFLIGMVLIAFAYIQIEKYYKLLKNNLSFRLSVFYWVAPFLIFLSSILLISLKHEMPTLPKWLYWVLIIIIALTSEIFIYLRKKKIRQYNFDI